MTALVRRALGPINHKRVERIYAQEGLQLPRRRQGRRRGADRVVPLAALTGPNQRWSMDFVQDSMVGGRRIKALTIVDQFTRECPAIEVDTSITGQRVVRVLGRLSETHRLPLGAGDGQRRPPRELFKQCLSCCPASAIPRVGKLAFCLSDNLSHQMSLRVNYTAKLLSKYPESSRSVLVRSL